MRKNWLLLFIATMLVSTQIDVHAQQQRKEKFRSKANDPVSKLPYHKKLRWADDLFKSGSYFNAIDYYMQLKQEQERNPYITYQLAECFWMTRDYVPAAHYFAETYALASKLYPEATFKEAMMLKMQGQYDLAIQQFNKFMADNPKTFRKLKLRAKREIEGCVMAKNSIKDPVSVSIFNAGPNVNSAYTEFSPMPLGDTALLFSTMSQNSVVEVDKRKRDEYMSRMMVAQKQRNVAVADSFQWPIRFMDGRFNDASVHVGNGCFSPGGDRFYFTKCGEQDSMKVVCKIYVSRFQGSGWSEPEMLGEGINDGGSNTHPFVARVGKKEVLFFSSNRKLQSRGGYDILYSVITSRTTAGTAQQPSTNGRAAVIEGERYSRPQNAGKVVNTENDEITPYYDSRVNKLYFASNGWVTMGGFDIFSADGGPSRYANLTNLGYPINTSADELYFVKDPSGKPDAYLVSNRIGAIALKNPTCCDDIWRIQFEPKLMVMGRAIDGKTNAPMANVVVKMTDEQGGMKTFNSADGNFAFNMSRGHSYVITGDKQGFASGRASVSTADVKHSDPDDTAFVTITMNANITPIRVSNVYYDYDKATLRPESIASLDTLVNFMRDNPSLSVEVYSFTDSKGTKTYNNTLSTKRAQAVIDYLVKNGIEHDRMIAKGLGDSNPAAPNEVGGKDNPMGRQMNRRTEFRIVTDVPNRRVIYDSTRPDSTDKQQRNLQIDDTMNDDDEADDESNVGKPGSRVNK